MTSTSYSVTIGDRVVRIELRRSGDAVFVRVDDGDEQPVLLSQVRDVVYSLRVGDRRGELLAIARGDDVALTVGGQEYSAQVVDEAHARLASLAGARAASHVRRELKAPMPGLLVRVLCQPGDTFEPGQPLVVLQAMKMENELSLTRGGTVTQVNVEAGQTVEQGQVLIVVE